MTHFWDDLFAEGDEPDLEAVLLNREERVKKTALFANRYPESTVVTFKLNIPGPIKSNEKIIRLYEFGMSGFLKQMNMSFKVLESVHEFKPTGPEGFCAIQGSPVKIKKCAVELENSPIGALYDIDVYCMMKDQLMSISRKDLEYPERKCLICSHEAKQCAGRRVHSVKELQQAIIDRCTMEGSM